MNKKILALNKLIDAYLLKCRYYQNGLNSEYGLLIYNDIKLFPNNNKNEKPLLVFTIPNVRNNDTLKINNLRTIDKYNLNHEDQIKNAGCNIDRSIIFDYSKFVNKLPDFKLYKKYIVDYIKFLSNENLVTDKFNKNLKYNIDENTIIEYQNKSEPSDNKFSSIDYNIIKSDIFGNEVPTISYTLVSHKKGEMFEFSSEVPDTKYYLINSYINIKHNEFILRGYKNSVDMFQNANQKRLFFNKYKDKIVYGYLQLIKCEKDKLSRYVVNVRMDNGRYTKFLLEDCEIVMEIVPIVIKRKKQINPNSYIKLINNRNYPSLMKNKEYCVSKYIPSNGVYSKSKIIIIDENDNSVIVPEYNFKINYEIYTGKSSLQEF